MAVATTIFLSVLKLIAVQRQSVELQTRQIQAGWLAESAVQRACGTAFRRSKLPRRNLEHFRTRHRRTRRRHDRDPRGRRPRQARSPHHPRRGRLPGRSLPTSPTKPRVIVASNPNLKALTSDANGCVTTLRRSPPNLICRIDLPHTRFYARRTLGRHRHHRHFDRHDVPRGRRDARSGPPHDLPESPGPTGHGPAKVRVGLWRASARHDRSQGTDPQCPAGHPVELDRALAPLSRRGGHASSTSIWRPGPTPKRTPRSADSASRPSSVLRNAPARIRPARRATMPAAIMTSSLRLPKTITACCSSTATSRIAT